MIKSDIQIRFSDIDLMGHVNNSYQQHYFDIGKSDYMKNIMKFNLFDTDHGVVAANTNTTYISPIMITDEVYVTTKITKLGNKSFNFYQEIIDQDGELKTTSSSVLVSFGKKCQCAVDMPQKWRDLILEYEGEGVLAQ